MERKYKQEITIGRNIDGIFNLPCVAHCSKSSLGGHWFYVMCQNGVVAEIGDKLCEDYNGKWWVEKP